jgi:hypothetical protein
MVVTNYLIGADIECFLKNRNGEVISAEGLVKGTKHDPFFPDPALGEFFSTSLDNVLAEFTIAPAKQSDEFVNNINISKRLLMGTLPEEVSLFFYPDNLMDEKYLQTRNAKLFGCDVSYSVWNGKPISINRDAYPTLRSAGFHVHIGYDEPSERTNELIIKTLDLFLGAPSVLIEPKNLRKTLYGKPGEFRMKPYGVEYRTLSSFFAENDNLISWVYNNADKAMQFLNGLNNVEDNENDCRLIVDAIDNCNKEAAAELVQKYSIDMP